jgi:hypothetical protein
MPMVSTSVTWKVQNPEDYESGRMSALVHMAGQGELAKQTLQHYNPETLARQAAEQAEQDWLYQEQVAARARAAGHGGQSHEQPIDRPDTTLVTYEAPASTLEDELLGAQTSMPVHPVAPEHAQPAHPGEAITPQEKSPRAKTPKSVRRLIRRTGLVLVTAGLVVPATHSALQVVNVIPFVHLNENDPMTFNGDLGHDASLIPKGLGEIVLVVTNGKVKS